VQKVYKLQKCPRRNELKIHARREDLCYKFVKKAAKFHPKLYPKKEILRETRLGDKAPLHVPKVQD
jgi:hypothetical protein